jgi:radial spoke head protein 9
MAFASQATNGNSLSPRLQIELALTQLLNGAEAESFDELLFWGKVTGLKADYYIALGLKMQGSYEFPKKQFYWCSQANSMTFEPFPELNTQHLEKLDSFAHQPFEGVPSKVLIACEKTAEQLEAEQKEREAKINDKTSLDSTDEEDDEALVQPVNLKEIDRLLFHVQAIETDCHIVPKGAFKLTPSHEVHRNEAFRGLAENAMNLGSYSHFRNVQDEVKKDGLEADDAIFKQDFLDEVTVQPRGCWSVQRDELKRIAFFRHLVWKGFLCFHSEESTEFGAVYVGDGLKNEHFCFQV